MNTFFNQTRLFTVFLLIGFLISANVSAQQPAKTGFSKLFSSTPNPDTGNNPPLHLNFILLSSPKDYKVFDNDPIDLFTRMGVHVGVNVLYRLQPWKPDSIGYLQMICANYGFARGVLNFEYLGVFHQLIGSWDLLLKSRFDVPGVENYFGTGNETIKPHSRTYNRTKSTRFYGGLGIYRKINNYHHLELSGFYQNIKIEKTSGHFIAENNLIDSTIFMNKKFAGLDGGYHYRKTNDDNFPTKGIDFSLGLGYILKLKENKSFPKLLASFSFYLPLSKSFSFGSRAGGATQGDGADFYYLNKLGGYVNLRGYLRERFYGKTIFYNNNELRWVTPFTISHYNGKMGLFTFFDEGRVWQPGMDSKIWHKGYGGGLILIPSNKTALTASFCHSTESNLIEAKAGVFF
jgi:hypothetical protein